MTTAQELIEKSNDDLTKQSQRALLKKIREKNEKEIKEIKAKKEKKAKKSKFEKVVWKSLKAKAVSKGIIKKSPQTIQVHQKPMGLQPMERDKSRFFKDTWEEEKRSLFFQ